MRITTPYRRVGQLERPALDPIVPNRSSWQGHGLIAWWPLLPHVNDNYILDSWGASHLLDEGSAAPNLAPGAGLGLGWQCPSGVNYGASYPFTDAGTARTIAFWLVITTDGGVNSLVFEWNNDAGSGGDSFNLRLNASLFRWAVSSAVIIDGTTTPVVNVPYLIVLRTVSSTSRQIFVNGVQEATVATANSASMASAEFHVRNSGANGVILYDVKVWQRDLSDGEIYALYAPETRWDLYGVRDAPLWMPKAAAVGGGSAFPHHYYQQMRG
jgi:hypothetical protein